MCRLRLYLPPVEALEEEGQDFFPVHCCFPSSSLPVFTQAETVPAAFDPSFQLLRVLEEPAALARLNSHGSGSPFCEFPLPCMQILGPFVSTALRVEVAMQSIATQFRS